MTWALCTFSWSHLSVGPSQDLTAAPPWGSWLAPKSPCAWAEAGSQEGTVGMWATRKRPLRVSGGPLESAAGLT